MDDWDDDAHIGGPADHNRDMSDEEGHAHNDAPGPADKKAAAEGAEAAIKVKRKGKPRPKVTLDLLKEPQGMNDVFCNFPHAMRAQCKGKGHEVGDLQRLLEMYSRWQQRIFPYGKFDDFILKLERLGSSAIVKNEMRELRQGLVKLLADEQQEGDKVGEGLAAADGECQVGVAAGPVQPLPRQNPVTQATAPRAAAPQPFPEEDDEEPPNGDDFVDEMDELAALQDEQWANAMDAMPDLDEQLFEAQAPQASNRPTGNNSSNRNFDHINPGLQANGKEQQQSAGDLGNPKRKEVQEMEREVDQMEEDEIDDDELLRHAAACDDE